MSATHPIARLDETIHQRVRLGILAVLAEADQADFGYLKDVLDLTDGNLSRHLGVLEEAGLVKINKGYEGKRPRTWVKATRKGRSAFAGHLAALQELIAQAGPQRKEQGV